MLGEGESLETQTFKRQVGEGPEKEPEWLLRLAAETLQGTALRKRPCLEEPEGDPEGCSHLSAWSELAGTDRLLGEQQETSDQTGEKPWLGRVGTMEDAGMGRFRGY